jgi:hypothetical protein
MKSSPLTVLLSAFVIFAGMSAAIPVAGQESKSQPAGKLVLFADTLVFSDPSNPDNCTMRNRFKRGDNVGFRLYAVDGGTNQSEDSAKVVVHIDFGGKTYDLPAKFRGIQQKNEKGMNMPIRPGMWTAKWLVPDDAPTGTVHYSAKASDKYGRTTEWKPQGGEPSFVTIVQ